MSPPTMNTNQLEVAGVRECEGGIKKALRKSLFWDIARINLRPEMVTSNYTYLGASIDVEQN